MKKLITLILASLLALSMLTVAFAATYTDKETVKKVQQALNDAGYDCGTPDGVSGKKTAAAITQYQTDKGLETTGTIDDALLEAMGLMEKESEADAGTSAEETEAASAESATENGSGESSQNDGVNGPKLLAKIYNFCFLGRLEDLGVDIEKEDIGQKAYIINNLYNEGWGYSLLADKIYIIWDNEAHSLGLLGRDKKSLKDLDFLDQAALYAYFYTVNNFFGGNEEDWSVLKTVLENEPARDEIVSVETMDVFFEDGDRYPHAFSTYSLNWYASGYNGDEEIMAFSAEPLQ